MQERKNSEAGNDKEVDYGRKSGQDNTSENVIENRPEKRVKNKGGNKMEEWISLTEYMKRFHIGFKEVKKMMDNKELEYKKSEGGRFRIKVGGNTVSRELYESEKEKRIQAETRKEQISICIIRESWQDQ